MMAWGNGQKGDRADRMEHAHEILVVVSIVNSLIPLLYEGLTKVLGVQDPFVEENNARAHCDPRSTEVSLLRTIGEGGHRT